MRMFIDFAVIQQRFDGVDHGDRVAPCRIAMLGESPHATVKAWAWNKDGSDGPGFVEFDRLLDATVVDNNGDRVSITGTSEKLVNEGILPADQAVVEWAIEIRGCQGCN